MSAKVVVSYSELDTYRQCPLKHALAYRGRWRKDREGGALYRGSLWHLVMENHYLIIQDAQKRWGKVRFNQRERDEVEEQLQVMVDAILRDPTNGKWRSDEHELVGWMYDGYQAYYGLDENWRILAVELKDEVPLLNERGGVSRFRLKVKMDLVVIDMLTGRIEIIDHKSASDFTRPTELDIDDQFGLYTWAARQRGRKVFCSVRSDARTQRNVGPMKLEARFQRLPSYRTDTELTSLALDAYRTAKSAYSAANAVPFSSPNPSICKWKCDFLQVHLQARKGVPIETALKDFGFTQDFTRH